MGRECSMHGEKGTPYKVLVRIPERNRPQERSRRRCDSIKILKKQVGGMWIGLIWLRCGQVMDPYEHGYELLASIIFW
jgi:hypothetical protein